MRNNLMILTVMSVRSFLGLPYDYFVKEEELRNIMRMFHDFQELDGLSAHDLVWKLGEKTLEMIMIDKELREYYQDCTKREFVPKFVDTFIFLPLM